MAKTLGLDLGTNSIGWAVIDNSSNKILGMGSRIFQEGVDNLGEGKNEMSKNASRTASRGTRRQFFRRRLRKHYLLKLLAKYNLIPIPHDEVKVWSSELFNNPKLKAWFKLNPYDLRARALNKEVSLHELSRIFYHMIQRRGFQSNSRSTGTDDGKIYEGNVKEGKVGILETQQNLHGKTLGYYLKSILPPAGLPFNYRPERIRNRYTTRKMYIDEYEAIWEKQKQYHEELTGELKALIGGRKKDGYSQDGVLFHQRPLKSQKHLLGYCSFEPKKHKCPKSAISFELFRIYQWVNTVENNGEFLSQDEKKIVINLLLSKEKATFKVIRKALNKLDSYYHFNYKDDDRIVGTHTISNLSNKKFFGPKWFNLSVKEQEDIWHALFFFEDKDKLKYYAINHWGFNEEQAEKISKFKLVDGYSNLSRKAIRNILPFLKKGYTYDLAVVLGGIKNAFGDKWDKLEENKRRLIEDNIYDIVRAGKKGGFIDDLKNFLVSEFHLTNKQLQKLYHHSASINTTTIFDKLPTDIKADREIQNIRNPIVITALFELRILVNEIIDLYGNPDEIKVELARDLKISKSSRNDIRREQKRLERENDRVKSELNLIGQIISHENIIKYKLWEECNKTCPYTGRKIEVAQLFSGEVQIEHIHPWSNSLNDSFMNKTLCFADENRAKGNKTPYEYYFNEQGEEKWEMIKKQALSCFKTKEHYPNAYNKFKHFIKTKRDDDFVSRQLNDTRYISKEAKNYLSKICENVMVAPGQMTANLRHKWGLNNILNNDDVKTREDHRHHAIDALVMTCSTVSHLQELSKWNRYQRNSSLKNFPMPWNGFFEDAEKAVNNVLVSHKKSNKLLTVRSHKTKKEGRTFKNKGVAARGQLHKETVYGKRKSPFQLEKAFFVRKPLESLTTLKHIGKIVDPVIRNLILARIDSLGGLQSDNKLPDDLFFAIDDNGNRLPQIFLPNKNGESVPVKKVRISEQIGGAEQLKENINQFVNPRNNHHVLIYIDENGNLKEEVVTFWTAIERKKQGLDVYKLPDPKKGEANPKEIVTTLQINDMFLLGLTDDQIDWNKVNYSFVKNKLYRVQKLSSKFYEFRLNSESQLNKNFSPYYIRIQGFGEGKTGWKSFNPIKVHITASGRIAKVI